MNGVKDLITDGQCSAQLMKQETQSCAASKFTVTIQTVVSSPQLHTQSRPQPSERGNGMNRLNLDLGKHLFRRAQTTKKLLRAFAYCQLLQITKRGKEHANPDRQKHISRSVQHRGKFL